MSETEDRKAVMGRRSFMWAAALAAAAPIVSEASLARAARASFLGNVPPDAVLINANENPLGPSGAACEAIAKIAKDGGRYDRWDNNDKLVEKMSSTYGLKPENFAVYAGSSEPLHYTVMAFTSPNHGLVIADPSYESPMAAAAVVNAPVSKVHLTADYAHDVKAMVAANPTAGLIYICNPNNPTGTITPKADIMWALENKPSGSILMVDEAYIHLSDADSMLDQVSAGKDLIVLRTFSKIYGMAGIRCGMAIGRPDLLARLTPYLQNSMPVTALVAAHASLDDPDLIPTRKGILGKNRVETLSWLTANGYKPIGKSESNCFMIDTGRDAHGVITGLREQKVYIGRVWPIWPQAVRVSVGTADDMEKFRVAFKTVMDKPAMAAVKAPRASELAGMGGTTFLS